MIDVIIDNERVTGVKFIDKNRNERIIDADKVILATGGKSYPNTGSTGDGYIIAQKLGHTITKIRPSLVPLECKNKSLDLCKELQGLSLRNIGMKLVDKTG